MKHIHSKYFLTLALLTTLLIWVLAGAKAAPNTPGAPVPLFRTSGLQVAMAANTDPSVVRSRLVDVNFALLDGDGTHSNRSLAVLLNLFDDTTYTATLVQRQTLTNGGYAWSGRLDDSELSQVIFVVFNGVTSASITLPGATYQIRPDVSGLHLVQEINDAALPPDLHKAIPAAEVPDPAPLMATTAQPDSGATIDVLILYTRDALAAAGSTVAMETLINHSIIQTNNAFSNSHVNTQLRLVHSAEVDYTEAGFDTDLTRLMRTSDEFLPEAHILRDQYSADLVSLFVAERMACGIAYIGTHPSYGFSVVNYG